MGADGLGQSTTFFLKWLASGLAKPGPTTKQGRRIVMAMGGCSAIIFWKMNSISFLFLL